MIYLITFLNGIAAFVSPCILPLIPVYVSYFAADNKNPVLNSVLFSLGFTGVFALLGLAAGSIGGLLIKHAFWVNLVSGLIVIVMGLSVAGLFSLSFIGQGRMKKPAGSSPFSALLLGVVFSLSWTPCIGAYLTQALMLAAGQGASAIQGGLMLVCFSVGLGIPFVLSALLLDYLRAAFDFLKRHLRVINLVCGLFLTVMGILIATGLFGRFIAVFA